MKHLLKTATICLILFLITFCSFSQTKKVLFLGNSYTYVNNLPQLTATLASSVGDSLLFDNNTPGGYTLEGHSTNTTSLNKIMQGNWDFVVLQEQSQRPSFPLGQVQNDVFPYATFLDSVINANNTCAETMFYMTWGRKNGDAGNCAAWPPVCTYQGMDSLLHLRYVQMANDNNAVVSPVGALWNYIRINHPNIELYSSDGSHPSVAGTYAAACSFYAAIFRKNPALITNNHALDSVDASNIRLAAKTVVYDSLLHWNIGLYDVTASFTYSQVSSFTYHFTNTSQNAFNQLWNINSTIDTSANPTYTFNGPGTYSVQLTSMSDCDTVISNQSISITATSIDENDSEGNSIFPNPVVDFFQMHISNVKNASLNIYDQLGRRTYTLANYNGEQINIEKLKSGIYFAELITNTKKVRVKFLKD